MSEEKIPAEELDSALKRCPEWEVEGDSITQTIEFEEYMESIDFVRKWNCVDPMKRPGHDHDCAYQREPIALIYDTAAGDKG